MSRTKRSPNAFPHSLHLPLHRIDAPDCAVPVECFSFSQRGTLSEKWEFAKACESILGWCLTAIISLALLTISSQPFWGKSSCLPPPSCLSPLFVDCTRETASVDRASSRCHHGVELGIFALAEQIRNVARTDTGDNGIPKDWVYADSAKSGIGHFERQEARSEVFSSSLDNISITPVPGFAYRTPFVLKKTKNVVVGTNITSPARLGATTFTKALFARIRSESLAKSNGTKPLSYLSDEAATGGQLMPVTVCLVRTSFLGIAFTSRVCVDESKFMTIATTTAAPTTTSATLANETAAESTSTSTTTLPPLPLPFHNTHVCDAINAVALSKPCTINPLVVYCVCPVSQLQKNSPNFVTTQPLDVTYTRDVVAADRNYLPWRSNLAKNYPSSSAFVTDGDSNTTTTTTSAAPTATGPTFLPPPLFADLCPGCDYYYRTKSKTMSHSITESRVGDSQTASSSKSLTDSSFILASETSATMSPTAQTTPSESFSTRSYSRSRTKTEFHPEDTSKNGTLSTSSTNTSVTTEASANTSVTTEASANTSVTTEASANTSVTTEASANSSVTTEASVFSNSSTSVWGSNVSESNGDTFTTSFAGNESNTNATAVSTEISRDNVTGGDTSSGTVSETNSTSTEVAPSNDSAPTTAAAALLFPPPPLRLGGEFRGAQVQENGATYVFEDTTTAVDDDNGGQGRGGRLGQEDKQARMSTNSRQMAPAAVDLTGFVQLQFQFQLEHADPLLLRAQSIEDVQEELDYLNSIVQYVIKETPDFAASLQLRKDKFRLQDVYSGLPSQPVAPTRAPTTTTTPNTNTNTLTPTSTTDTTTTTTTTSSPPTTTTTGTTTTSTPLTSPSSTVDPTSTATTTVTTTSTTATTTTATTTTTTLAPTSAPTTTLIVTDVTNATNPSTRHRIALTVVKDTLLVCLVLLIIPAVVVPYICYKSWKKGKWEAYKLRNFRLSDDPADADAVTMDDVEMAVNGHGAGIATDRMGLSTFGIATSAIPVHGAAGNEGGGGPSVPVPLVDVNKDGSKGVRYGGDNDLLAMRVGMGQGKWARSPSLAGGGVGADGVGRKGRNALSQQPHLYGNLAAAEFDPVRDHAAQVKAAKRRAAKRQAKRDAVKRAVAEENTQVMGDEIDAAEGGLANTADEGEDDGGTQRGTKGKGGSGAASAASTGEVALDFDDDDEEDDEENDGENEDGYDSDKAGLNSTRGTLAPTLSISSPFSSTNVRKKLLLLDSEEQSHLRRRTAANVLQLVTAGLEDATTTNKNAAGKKQTASGTQAKLSSTLASNGSLLLTGNKKNKSNTAGVAAPTVVVPNKSDAPARHHRREYDTDDDDDDDNKEEYSDAGDAEGHGDENDHNAEEAEEEEEYEEIEEFEEEAEAEGDDDENMR